MLLSSVINNFKDARVLCIGDIMLDHYIYGDVRRISPEAPVPVFEYGSRQSMLGGSGNVVNNLHALGCQVRTVCLVGKDAPGAQIRSLLSSVAPDSLILESSDFTTIEKTRIVAEHNHILRIDNEKKYIGCATREKALKDQLPPFIDWADVVLLSDYAKGMLSKTACQWIIDNCHRQGCRVIVDPKGSDYSKYAGAFLIKPNLAEFIEVSGVHCLIADRNFEASIKIGAKQIFALGVKHLIITLSQHGMVYISADDPDKLIRIPTTAREIFDVSGAGDTSLAVIGASLAGGAPIEDAMKLANLASGIAVGKIGTSAVDSLELTEALTSTSSGNRWKQKVKIISKKKAAEIAKSSRERNLKVVFTNGCFDLLHFGHLKSLMSAKSYGDVLMVGVNTDASIKKLKGSGRPIQDEKSRSLLLASLEFVDYVIMFDEETALSLVEAINPDIIAKEGYSIENWPEARQVESNGGHAVTLPRVEGYSTSNIISRIIGSRV